MNPNGAEWMFTQAPIWVVGGLTLLSMIAAFAIGERLHRRRVLQGDAEAAASQDGFVVSSVLGLLALLLGFTFGLAVDRFDTRRGLVVEEANAIGTTYLRAQTFDGLHRSALSSLLARYVDLRIALAENTNPAEASRMLAMVDTLHAQLWAETVAAVAPLRDDISANFMESMNATIDVAASRKASRLAHVPSIVFTVLLIYMVVAAGALGYVLGDRRRSAGTMLVLLTLSFLLIVDIDSPNRGGVLESQTPMRDLKAFIAAHPSASFHPMPSS